MFYFGDRVLRDLDTLWPFVALSIQTQFLLISINLLQDITRNLYTSETHHIMVLAIQKAAKIAQNAHLPHD